MTIRWGVVGPNGFASKRPIPGLMKAANSELVAFLGHRSKLDDVADQFQVPKVYYDAKEFWSDPEIDAVYICTPVHLHAELTLAAAKAGKHVLVEKPIARTVEEAEEMIAVCEKHGVKLQVGFMRRFHPYHMKIKEIIDQGRLGQVMIARVQTHLWYPDTPSAWRQIQDQGGGGALMDVGSHCLDMMRFLLGPISPQNASIATKAFNYAVDDTAVLTVLAESGATGIVDCSFSIPFSNNSIEIYGTKGTLVAQRTAGPFTDPSLTITNAEGTQAVEVTLGHDQFQMQFESMANCILHDQQPEPGGETGLQNLKLMKEFYELAR